MSTNTQSDRSKLAKERVETAQRLRANDHTKEEMSRNYATVVALKAEGRACQNCAAYVRVKFMGCCKAQRMKLVKEQNICHLWQ